MYLDRDDGNTEEDATRKSFGDERGKEALEFVDSPARLAGEGEAGYRGPSSWRYTPKSVILG